MSRNASARFVRASAAALVSIAALVGYTSQALAAADDEVDEELTEVQVTGTRILSPNVTAANPVTSITGEEMRSLGFVNVADALTMLVPQNISTYMPSMTGDDQALQGDFAMGGVGFDRGSFFIGNTIANLRGLDPAFGSRTLTLIDGRRSVSTSNQADVVDMNIIPSNLLQRMDVVTGGASATYGSGAVAGVVNLVLNNRMHGVNLDLDYGVNEAGDGGSPHISISGGMPFFGGRAHGLFGAEWQDQRAIRDCAAARDWCAESRQMFSNSTGSAQDPTVVLSPMPGFEDMPARFEMANVRYGQFSPNGAIYVNDASRTSGWRFTEDGTDIEEYSFGFRGGTGSNTINGDGPLVTTGTTLRPSSERRTLFTNFEFNVNERTTAYFQGNYANTTGENRNRYTLSGVGSGPNVADSAACVRFDVPGVAAVAGGTATPGQFLVFGPGPQQIFDPDTGVNITADVNAALGTRSPLWGTANFRAYAGAPALAQAAPYWVAPGQHGSDMVNPPTTYPFANGMVGQWRLIRLSSATGTLLWHLLGVTYTGSEAYNDPGTPAVLPEIITDGRSNAYAFLGDLSPEALYQVMAAFNNAPTAGGGANTGKDSLFGTNACNGFTALRKVWNPQVQQWTEQESETMRGVLGVKGFFGGDWRWEAYYQHGKTDSTSRAFNIQSRISFAFAMDAVIDDRETLNGAPNPDFGRPICRITRDGVPVLDTAGRPLSDPEGLAALAAGCQPLNVFGSTFSDPDAAELQSQALDYAFKDTISDGSSTLQTLSFTTSGTLWGGIGAGPLTGAFGLEFTDNSVDNRGTRGPFYLRGDLANNWGDAFGGSTRSSEAYTELNLPLVSGLEGVNLFSLNFGARHTHYKNKGGAGTTGETATQNVFNWKAQALYEPFDWFRLRLTRSRDLRAAGYRDLFLYQPRVPDQFSGTNPWRERTAYSTESQTERWGQVQVGNSDLKPEKSDTLTVGFVLSPGGWAQGMRLSADYYNIRVRDGIAVPFRAGNPIQACWEASGNIAPTYVEEELIDAGINGQFDDSLTECREITFASNADGSRNLEDIVSYNSARPDNILPYQRRGIDVAWSYVFALNRAFESVPGSLSLTVRGTRALESSGIELIAFPTAGMPANTEVYRDLVGQIRSNFFIPGVSASPKWTGNIITSYSVGELNASLSARYIGGAMLDKNWCDTPSCPNYQNELGQFLNGSVDHNWVDPYMNFALNGSYNLDVGNLKQFQVFGSINNLFDKSPPFTGGGISGASAQYHDTMGRSYRMGVRMRF